MEGSSAYVTGLVLPTRLRFFDRMEVDVSEPEKQSVVSPDSNVELLRQKLLQRSEFGLKKYGCTTDRDDVTLGGWLNHMLEELLDAAVYTQALLSKIPKSLLNMKVGKIDRE